MRALLVGLFSARERLPERLLEAAARGLEARGIVVVGRLIQRRGVSRGRARPGGALRMASALSAAHYLGSGKAKELAAMRAETGVDLVVLVGSPSPGQRDRLALLVGCEVEVISPDSIP